MVEDQQTETDTSANPTSPYFVHPSDSNYKLSPTIFTGVGYNDWKRAVIISLSAKYKLGFIDGSITDPGSSSPLYHAWIRVNNTIIAWFMQSLDFHIGRSIIYFKTAREVWLNLEERFGQTSETQVFSLVQQISEVDQGVDNVSVFYTKLKMMWDELDATSPTPICTCNKCTCNVNQRIFKDREDLRLTQFLMKLSPDFKVVRGSILLQSPLPPITHAYRLLMQEEKQHGHRHHVL